MAVILIDSRNISYFRMGQRFSRQKKKSIIKSHYFLVLSKKNYLMISNVDVIQLPSILSLLGKLDQYFDFI